MRAWVGPYELPPPIFFCHFYQKWTTGEEGLAVTRGIGPRTPTPSLCGIPSGLVDLGAYAPAQWPPQTYPRPSSDSRSAVAWFSAFAGD